MAELLTIDALMKATETDLPLSPRLMGLLGRPTIRVKTIDGGRLGCLYPLLPDEVSTGAREGLTERERSWLRSLPTAERIRHRLEVESVKFHVLALVALEPALTFDQAERLGDEANDLYLAVLRFSGLMPAAAPPAEPAPADAAVEQDAVAVGA